MNILLKTIDAHVAGQPLRLIVEGFPNPVGPTMLTKQRWLTKHHDGLRRLLMLEPRGHTDMCGAVLTEPVETGSHAGVLFMHTQGFGLVSIDGVIGVVTVALEKGLLQVADETDIRLDTPVGTVRAIATREGGRVKQVSVVAVPSFVSVPRLDVKLGARDVSLDVAFGGGFYVIIDSETAGAPILPSYVPALRALGMEIADVVESRINVSHPELSHLRGLHGTIFTGLPHAADADLRSVTVSVNGQVDRSPGGNGTAAVMSVLDAMNLLPVDRPFVHESIIGTSFEGRIEQRILVGETSAIVPCVTGAAWITGDHAFVLDARDPVGDGFLL